MDDAMGLKRLCVDNNDALTGSSEPDDSWRPLADGVYRLLVEEGWTGRRLVNRARFLLRSLQDKSALGGSDPEPSFPIKQKSPNPDIGLSKDGLKSEVPALPVAAKE